MSTPKPTDTLKENFYANAQKIIDKYYLTPHVLNNQGDKRTQERVNKTELRDGVIERSIHGGMHVARVQYWTLILNKIFKNTASDYHQTVMDSFKTQFDLDESEVIILTRYAALFHDSARQNEAADRWDKESAENTYQYLVDNKIDDKTARLIQHAAEFKDKPKKFDTFLQSNNLDEHGFAFHYIRKLIAMSDCLDIMRCVGSFNIDRVLAHITDITTFLEINATSSIRCKTWFRRFFACTGVTNGKQKSELETRLIQLSKDIYDVLVKQKDMLYPCAIISNDECIYPKKIDKESQHSLQFKIRFEHASDVCKTIGSDLQNTPSLAALLKDEAKHFQEYDLQPTPQPAFNPHLHGSNSCVLSLLARTKYQLMSPMDMMDKFNTAPMCGERGNSLYGGGLDNLNPGSWTSWGLLRADGTEEYGIDMITGKYASESPLYFELSENLIHQAIETGFKKINMILIHLITQFQRGEKDSAVREIRGNILPKLNAFIQCHYLLLLMGRYISADKEKYKAHKLKPILNPIINTITELFTLPNIVRRIQDSKIDFKAIYEKKEATEADLTTVIDFLNEPLMEILRYAQDDKDSSSKDDKDRDAQVDTEMVPSDKSNDDVVNKLVELIRTKSLTKESLTFFSRATSSTTNQKNSYYAVEKLLINRTGYEINFFINDCITGEQSTLQWATENQKYILANVALLEQKRDKAQSLLSANIEPLCEEDLSFTQKPFPLMFVNNLEETTYLTDFGHQEYRSYRPLKIGKDITMLATDTVENQNTLLRYLKKHGLSNVSVVLFQDLQQSLVSKKAPTGIKASNFNSAQEKTINPSEVGLFAVTENKKTTTAESGLGLDVML